MREVPDTRSPAAFRLASLVEWLAWILTEAFLLYTFVGFDPFPTFQPGARVLGDSLDRLAILSMSALALTIVVARWRTARQALASNLLLTLVVLWLQVSVIWSGHPDLTLRRASFVALTTLVTLAVAVGTPSPRSIHTALFATLSGIVALNLIGVALWPDLAISDIGVMGIYGQKNIAGMMAMLTLVVSATWLAGTTSRRQVGLGLAPTGLTLFFLVITQSKTSIAIALVALGLGGLVWLSLVVGRRMVLLIFTVALFVLSAVLGLFVVNDFNTDAVLGLFLADTSFTGRDELWRFAVSRASDRLWLGHGYGAFWDVGALDDPFAKLEPGTWLGDVAKGVINQAHNGYLELWLNAGLPAMLAAVAAVVAGMISAARLAVGRASEGRSRATLALIALTLFMYLIHNMTEATLFQRGSPFFALVLILSFLKSRRDFWPTSDR